jgi:ferredoxin
MRVWIDQDLCTGLALCERECPELFVMTRDGVAHLLSDGNVVPRGQAAPIPPHLLESVIEAAEDCPEACIFIDA